MANNEELTLEELRDFEDHGMRCRSVDNYEEEFKSKFGRELSESADMVLVGEYGDLVYDDTGAWTKFMLIGEDIGDGEFYFFIKDNLIFLDKGSLMLQEDYHLLFIDTIDQFFGPDVTHTVDYRGLKG